MTFLSNAWPWLLVAVLALTTTVSYIGLARYFVGYCITSMERTRDAHESLQRDVMTRQTSYTVERERRAEVEQQLTQLMRERNDAVAESHRLSGALSSLQNDFLRVSTELSDLQHSPRARAQRSRKGTR